MSAEVYLASTDLTTYIDKVYYLDQSGWFNWPGPQGVSTAQQPKSAAVCMQPMETKLRDTSLLLKRMHACTGRSSHTADSIGRNLNVQFNKSAAVCMQPLKRKTRVCMGAQAAAHLFALHALAFECQNLQDWAS